MKRIFTILILAACPVLAFSQNTFTIGENTIETQAEFLCSVDYSYETPAVDTISVHYYAGIEKGIIEIVEIQYTNSAIWEITRYRIPQSKLHKQNPAYIDDLELYPYPQPISRIYFSCQNEGCIESTSYVAWSGLGMDHETTVYQIDSYDKKALEYFLAKIGY